MKTLNLRVHLQGIQWQKACHAGHPAWFRAIMALGNKPYFFKDDNYIELIQVTGIAHKNCE
jgi:hypothetical protein